MRENDLFRIKKDLSPHADDFAEGIRNAILGDLDTAKVYFTIAADRAHRNQQPGYEKFYQALIAWIEGNLNLVKKYSNDLDVMHQGKKRILDRLVKAKQKDPNVSFATAYRYGQFYGR